jgi:hypothetical protein
MVRDGLLVERRPPRGILPYFVRSWLQRNSMSYVFLWNAWNQIRPLIGRTGSDVFRPERDLVTRERIPYVEQGYRVTSDLLKLFQEEAAANKIPLLIVLIPAEYQVYPQRFQSIAGKEGADPGRFDLSLPSRRWTELAQRAGIPVLDLLPVFQTRASGTSLYMSLDGHLTIEGNRVAGEAIASALRPLIADTLSQPGPS